jgi:hypothetical protein
MDTDVGSYSFPTIYPPKTDLPSIVKLKGSTPEEIWFGIHQSHPELGITRFLLYFPYHLVCEILVSYDPLYGKDAGAVFLPL